MEYIRSQNQEKYKQEMLDLSFEMRSMIKDPRCGIKKLSAIVPVFIILEIALITCSIPMIKAMITDKSISLWIFAAIVFFCFFYVTLLLLGYFARKRTVKKSDGSIDCDEKGINYRSSTRECTTEWSSIQCIRVFDYTLVVIPKTSDISKSMLIPVENLQGIEECMKEYDVDIEIIR